MSSSNAVRARFENLRSLLFSSISGSYAAVGGAFANPVRIVKVSNTTNANLLVSFNGTEDHDIVPANSFVLYDFTSNKANSADYLQLAQNGLVYVKQESSAPTSGTAYVTIVYAAS